jgi:hypothetical protein
VLSRLLGHASPDITLRANLHRSALTRHAPVRPLAD